MPATKKIEGAFTVKEGPNGELSLDLEGDPGLALTFRLRPEIPMGGAHELKNTLNQIIAYALVSDL